MLTSKQQQENDRYREEQDRQTLQAVIEQQVIRRLGEAGGPHNIQVRRLWADHYRVNVLAGNPTNCRITNSYFVEADGEGQIVGSNPQIEARRSSC